MEASFWHKTEGGKIQCDLCPQACLISSGGQGICKNRGNRDGALAPLLYGKVAAKHVDPIEKKPLYHFYPGSEILSVGFIGCNFHCPFCQNYQLVEGRVPLEKVEIEDLIQTAKREKSIGIAYTYNEPLVNFEWVRDCATAFRKAGLKNVAVTNGYLNPEPFAELAGLIDAFNIDLKYASGENYKKYSGAKKPEAIRENIETAYKKSHVEVTHLVVTGINDDKTAFSSLIDQVACISKEIPLHLSAYRPMYKYDAPPTSLEFLEWAFAEAKKKLDYVYLGNVWSEKGASTECRKCEATLVKRSGYSTKVVGLKGDVCTKCGEKNYFKTG